jgi:hypothetical protein
MDDEGRIRDSHVFLSLSLVSVLDSILRSPSEKKERREEKKKNGL